MSEAVPASHVWRVRRILSSDPSDRLIRPEERPELRSQRPCDFLLSDTAMASQAPLVRLEARGGWECGRYKSHQMQLSGLPDAQTHDTHPRT